MGVLKIMGVLILLGFIYIFVAPFSGLFFGQYFSFMKFDSHGISENAPTLIPGFLLLNIITVHLFAMLMGLRPPY